jgi:RNA polymerase sigma factor (sigma-70 family)
MMSDAEAFASFLRRVRAGEAQAAVELVQQFELLIRIEVRRRLNDPYLNRLLDSTDVCQSVLASFFVRAAAGQFELREPEDLLKLLLSMARKKVASQARKQQTQARDSRRAVEGPEILDALDKSPPPDRLVAGQELLAKFLGLLSADERRLADSRAEGLTWPEIAAAMGGQAQARRRQLDRALDRAAQELGLEDNDA